MPTLLVAACLLCGFGFLLIGEVNHDASLLNPLLVVVLLLNLVALGDQPHPGTGPGVALQGMLLGVMPLLVHQHLTIAPGRSLRSRRSA